MTTYLAHRLAQSLIVLLGISVVVFIILHLTGDPTLLMLPPDVSAEEVARFRRAMGFDDPLYVQYWGFLKGAVRGDFGNSLRHDEPALGLVWQRMPATIELTVAALGLALVLAIPVGIVSAAFRNTPVDYASTTFALMGQAMPISGWMHGITWLTLPTSDEPRRSGIAGPSLSPAVCMLAANRSSSAWFRLRGS